MGGRKIVRLLEAADLSGVRRLVLSPNTDWPAVRAFIAARRWALEDERLVADRDANYLVLAVRPLAAAEPPAWTEADLELGPLLRHRPDPTFRTWVARTLAALDGALARSTDAAPDDPQRRRTLARAALFRAAHEDSAGP
jgi:tRNA A22 N-methylase